MVPVGSLFKLPVWFSISLLCVSIVSCEKFSQRTCSADYNSWFENKDYDFYDLVSETWLNAKKSCQVWRETKTTVTLEFFSGRDRKSIVCVPFSTLYLVGAGCELFIAKERTDTLTLIWTWVLPKNLRTHEA